MILIGRSFSRCLRFRRWFNFASVENRWELMKSTAQSTGNACRRGSKSVMRASGPQSGCSMAASPLAMPEEKPQTLQASTKVRPRFRTIGNLGVSRWSRIVSKGFTKKFKRIAAREKRHFVPTSKQTIGKRQRSCGVASALTCKCVSDLHTSASRS